MRAFSLASLVLLIPCAAGGNGESKWGTEMSQETPIATATMYYSDAVDAALAKSIFQAMIDANYNFASGLPEQVDRVDGRLTLRLGNDNQESISEIIAEGEENGAVSYFHGLALHLSGIASGEEIDIVLCRESLDDAFYTVKWAAQSP